MSDKDAPAFPAHDKIHGVDFTADGLSKRQLAAILLCVPDSGEEWLDSMIRAAQRQRTSATLMQELMSLCVNDTRQLGMSYEEHVARNAVECASTLLAIQEESQGDGQ